MTARFTPPAAAVLDARFADRVRLVREGRSMSRRGLADRAGMSAQQIAHIEAGYSPDRPTRRQVSIGEAVLLCRALGVTPEMMLRPEPLDAAALAGGGR